LAKLGRFRLASSWSAGWLPVIAILGFGGTFGRIIGFLVRAALVLQNTHGFARWPVTKSDCPLIE
jgi:hypothetical protein